MKTKLSLRLITGAIFVLIALFESCSSSKDPVAANSTSGSATATLGGSAFTATTSKATDTGSGLELTLADASSKITLSLSDKVAGTYSIVNSSSGRTQALNYTISVLKDGVIYNGVTGSLVITANADGTLTAAFEGTLKSSTGLTLTMSSGKLLNFSVASVPSTGCKITSIAASYPSNCDGASSVSFYYNSDGKISKAIYANGTSQTFNYDLGGKLIGVSTIYSGGTGTTELTYSGNNLASFKTKDLPSGQTATSTAYTISYSAGSTISSVALVNTGASSSTGTRTISFTNGNLASHTNASTNSGITSTNTYAYAGYDTKKNPWALLSSLTGAPISFVYDGGINLGYFDFQSLSANNPGTLVRNSESTARTFTYIYNAQNYPSQIVYNYGGGCSITFVVSYSGCQ